MNKKFGLGVLATGMAIAGTLVAEVKPADAFVVHDGWNYSMDAHNDSTPFKRDGKGKFEIRGMAYKVIGEKAYFAINSNVDLNNGVTWDEATAADYRSRAADDDRVDFGDILINFTGESLDQANGDLFGIRFAAGNDSGVSELGVYSNVNASSVAGSNAGWSSMNAYNNYLIDKKNVTPTIGDLAYDDSYFDLSSSPANSISTGTKVGDIEFLANLNDIGLDFDFFGNVGSNMIAFTFDAGLLPSGEALYHLAMECNNDLVAGRYISPSDDTTDVPTPAAILPAILGMFGAASRKKNQGQEEA